MCRMHRVTVPVLVTIAVVLSGRPVWCQSEGAVHGQVVAAADHSALPQAAVMLTSVSSARTRQTTTDAQGRFVFQSVAAGHYVISASAEGFRTPQVQLTLEPREARAVTLSLELASLDVSVKVTAAEPLLSSVYSPSSTLLTSDRLETMPVFERTSLPDAIVTSAPGMIRGHDDFVHIRGHEIALNPLINGVSFWENTHAAFSSGLAPDVIETANVMTGGFPAEYGNRFGGIVDIVTKSGLRMTNRGTTTLSAGDAGRRHVTGEVGGARGAFGYYIFGSMFESGRFFSTPGPQAIHDDARGGHAFAAFEGNVDTMGALRAILMADGINAQIPKTERDMQLRPRANAAQRMRQQTAIFGWTRARAAVMMSASAYQRWSSFRLLPAAGPLTAQGDLTRALTTVGGKADVTRVTGRHAFKAGVDAVRLRPEEALTYDYSGYRDLTHLLGLPHIHLTGHVIAFAGREAGNQVSAYVQDRIQLGTGMTVDIGLRTDHYDLVISDTHLSPRINLAVNAGSRVVLNASYNHFFVPPAVEGVLSSSAGLTRSIREIGLSLAPLAPTIEDQFEAGASALSGPFQLALTTYFRTTDNPVHTTNWPDSRIYSYASFDRARAYGLELKVDAPGLAHYGVTANLNYALGRVHFYNPVTGGFITESAHLNETSRFLAPMDQTHTLTGSVMYRHLRTGVWAATAIEYGSGTPIGHDTEQEHPEGASDHRHEASTKGALRVSGHVTGNLSLGVDLWRDATRRSKLTLRLDVENVANKMSVIARESQFSPSQYSNPRLISATARFRF